MAQWAAETPDALAVAAGGTRLTYAELNARADRLADALRERGVGPEALVAICAERSPEMIVGLLGILRAGGAYVPMDPAYPKERLAYMLADSGAKVLLTQRRLLPALPEFAGEVILLDAESMGAWEYGSTGDPAGRPTLPHAHTPTLPHSTAAGNLAYVIYTSGSTGRPKGVEIEHGSLNNLVAWHQRVYEVTPADRATQVAGPAFDASVWEIWPYLTAGASIHIPDDETRAFPERLLEWLGREGITLTFLPTPLAEAVLAAEEEQRPARLALRALLTGGDRLHRGPREGLSFQVVNHYGPTENTVVSTATPVAPGAWLETPPPIGRPIDDSQVYILDAYRQPVPVGVPGEVYVGGAGLARGYHGREDLTAERFVDNGSVGVWECGSVGGRPDLPYPHTPTLPDSPTRLYRTGDLARYLPDGSIDFLGRIDHQVKIRGFRIELGEIEAVLGQHPDVSEAAVLAREEVPGDRRLVAYVVPAQSASMGVWEYGREGSGQSPTLPHPHTPKLEGLRAFLAERLPEYMVPAAFVALDALPLTANGKVDRNALPAPELERPAEDLVAPRDELEERLARLWGKVLGVSPVGVRDSFFALGGHSLLAVRLFSQMSREFGRELPLSLLFQAPTVEQLADVLRQEEPAAPRPWVVAVQPRGARPPLFCVQGGDSEKDLLVFQPLVELLGSDQPFYALRLPGSDAQEMQGRVPEMAARYIEEVRAVQPQGPYYLGGYCFGGLVAYEMAVQMREAGLDVALVVLLDSAGPGYRKRLAGEKHGMAGPWLERMRSGARYRMRMLRRNTAANVTRACLAMGVRLPGALEAFYRREMGRQAITSYVPKPYAGRAVLFRPDAPAPDPSWGWGAFATGRLDVHAIPSDGSPECLLGPGLPLLAEKLAASLQEARRGA